MQSMRLEVVADRRRDFVCALLALALLGCGERAHEPPEPVHDENACPTTTIDVPTSPGFLSAAVVETHARVLVQHDIDPRACVVSVVVRRESTLLEVSYEGATYRARLAGSVGTLREGIAEHIAAQSLMRRLLDAHVTTAISSGGGVALGLGDHTAVCHRSLSAPICVRAPAVLALDSLSEPAAGQLVVDAISDGSASEWELTFGGTTTLTTRTGTLGPVPALGEPPPAADRFADARSASPEQSSAAAQTDAVRLVGEMPTRATNVRLETHAVAGTRLAVLERCDALVPHCITVMASEHDGAWIFAPSFASDPARVDLVDDASTLAPGAILVRLIETSARDGSARDVFLVPAGERSDAYDVTLGSDTERGEGETATQGCYRALTIEGANRVHLSNARGWSGTHTARGWSITPRPTCAADETLCLQSGTGFGACG